MTNLMSLISLIRLLKLKLRKTTDTRMVYLLMSLVLLVGLILNLWEVIIFVIVMLNLGVWSGFCPSKWLFGKMGCKKTRL